MLQISIEPLNAGHQREGFDCGEESLNRYLWQYASQHQKKNLGRIYAATAGPQVHQSLSFLYRTTFAIRLFFCCRYPACDFPTQGTSFWLECALCLNRINFSTGAAGSISPSEPKV